MRKLGIMLVCALLVLIPFSVKAISLPYGGFTRITIPCTCPPFGTWVFYFPLFLGGPFPTAGALYYPPWAILYAFYSPMTPETWQLGKYTEGGQCLIISGTGCIPIPALGTIEFLGTSLPTLLAQ